MAFGIISSLPVDRTPIQAACPVTNTYPGVKMGQYWWPWEGLTGNEVKEALLNKWPGFNVLIIPIGPSTTTSLSNVSQISRDDPMRIYVQESSCANMDDYFSTFVNNNDYGNRLVVQRPVVG